MNQEEYREALALEALGALEASERLALEAYLETRAEYRREVAEMRDTAAALAYTVAPVAVPAALRTWILESIKAHPRTIESSEVDDKQTVDTPASHGAEVSHASNGIGDSRDNRDRQPSVAPSNVVPLRPRASLASALQSWVGAIAASIIIAVLVGALVVQWRRNNDLRAQLTQLAGRSDEMQQQLAREREERELFSAQDARVLALAGTKIAPRASARLAYERGSGRAVLYTNNLPPAPTGKAYQLWFIAGGKPLPGAVFKPDSEGHATLRDTVPAAGRNASTFAVTLEPEQGASTPTPDAMYLLSGAS